MPRIAKNPEPIVMSPESVEEWIGLVKQMGLAQTDREVAAILGRSHDTLAAMRRRGADRHTALACAAILRNLQPFGVAA